jgi:hypothetical protein
MQTNYTINNGEHTPPQAVPYGMENQQPQEFYGVHPMMPQLPPPPCGHTWVPDFQILPWSDGRFYPTCIGFYLVPLMKPNMADHKVSITPLAQEKVQKTAEAIQHVPQQSTPAVSIGKTEQDDVEGEFGDGGLMVINPVQFALSASTEDLKEINALLAPPKKVMAAPVLPVNMGAQTHAEALEMYRSKFFRKGNQDVPVLNMSYPQHSRNGYYASPEVAEVEKWNTAATHFLPLEIIENIEKMNVLEDIGDYGRFRFVIPCSVTYEGKFAGDNKIDALKVAAIEIVFTEDGIPVHFFLRPCNGKNETYLEKNLKGLKDHHK